MEEITPQNELLKPKVKRGFALMSPDKQKEIAAKGGKSAHVKGVAHKWTSEEARIAGKKGRGSATKKAND